MASFLLGSPSSVREPSVKSEHARASMTYRTLVHPENLIHVLIYRQQERVPFSKLVAVLVLRIQQRQLVLRAQPPPPL